MNRLYELKGEKFLEVEAGEEQVVLSWKTGLGLRRANRTAVKPSIVRMKNKKTWSKVQHLLSVCEALGSITHTVNEWMDRWRDGWMDGWKRKGLPLGNYNRSSVLRRKPGFQGRETDR